ncbi:uncharacterized protein Z519_05528 [Cladophialophora bantiana CBS 173.52]|uniref:Uncharacterized protein n=1 Tax=Cladophialophora bantiana (strain ATCC 10958 / CBS 173.52 / CDC B-1940 / NIH 8579) TaxID=1442370 RepID=A0A0D2G6I0_CLAB1|nr:uncharacterized protein Z519_05528 [Cladophialophora bantiana CBS 173.52]KIW94212.1 hypothetical protein Z519_05528 [Cladophialophora bantiana CBS 173.52]
MASIDSQGHEILCALPTALAAVQLMLDETHQEQRLDPRDDTQYTLGSIRDHNVAIACLSAGQIFIGAAASIASRMSTKFPRAVYQETLDPISDYEMLFTTLENPCLKDSKRTGFLDSPPQPLLQALVNLQARHLGGDHGLTTHLNLITNSANFKRPGPESDVLFESFCEDPNERPNCSDCDRSQKVNRESREHGSVIVHHGAISCRNRVGIVL